MVDFEPSPISSQSEADRLLAVILECEATKWFKPAKGQFQIFYKSGPDHPESLGLTRSFHTTKSKRICRSKDS